LIYLLLVGPLRTDDEFVVFSAELKDFVGLEKQDNSISIGSITKESSVIETKPGEFF
jgi:hypothetical protein